MYDCYWTLFIFSVLLLSTDHCLQDSKKNERTARSHSRKGPGYEVLVAYTMVSKRGLDTLCTGNPVLRMHCLTIVLTTKQFESLGIHLVPLLLCI